MFNRNIGCIEINKQNPLQGAEERFNRNIGCIEMQSLTYQN